jgi:hypothetical protein
MADEKKAGNGRVVVLPVIPTLPSGVYDMGTVMRLVSEADLANNPPGGPEDEETAPAPEESGSAKPKSEED